MAQPKTEKELTQAFRDSALKLPGVEEGVACAGTALEKRTIKVRGKAFLFLGKSDAMLKLGDSLPEATKLAAREPERYKVGGTGWVTVTYGDAAPLPVAVLRRWIEESYRLFAPKLAASAAAKPNASARMKSTRKRKQ